MNNRPTIPQHIFRALLAAAITLLVVFPATIPEVWMEVISPKYPAIREIYVRMLPQFAANAATLLLMLSPLLVLLWKISFSRDTMANPWLATACGAMAAVLFPPLWLLANAAIFGGFEIDLAGALRYAVPSARYTAPLGMAYFFLHSFFIRQLVSKKAWDGERHGTPATINEA